MSREAPMPPVRGMTRGGRAVQKNPRQFDERWLEAMRPLPSQIRVPLHDALRIHSPLYLRLRALDEARYQLRLYSGNARIYADSVDAKLEELGSERIDLGNPLQVEAFAARIGVTRKAIEKRGAQGAAIAYAKMTIEWLEQELGHEH